MWKITFKNNNKPKKVDLEAELLKAYQLDNLLEHKNLVKFFNNAANRTFQSYNSQLGCATFLVDNLEVKFALQDKEVDQLQAMVNLGEPDIVLNFDETGYMKLTCLLERWAYTYTCYSAHTSPLY